MKVSGDDEDGPGLPGADERLRDRQSVEQS